MEKRQRVLRRNDRMEKYWKSLGISIADPRTSQNEKGEQKLSHMTPYSLLHL